MSRRRRDGRRPVRRTRVRAPGVRAPASAALLATALLTAATVAVAAGPAALAAQGTGSAGGELLRMSAGTRAAGLGGAYTAVLGDPDGVFYNPSSVAGLGRAAGIGYQAYVEDITIGTASGGWSFGRFAVGAGLVFLDAGTIDEIVPDPDFGGERGRPTGNTVGATETAARLAAAMRLADGRAAIGVAAGFVASDLAGVSRSAPFIDIGGHYRLGALTLGASARNLGGEMSGDDMGAAPLPSEARLGAAYRLDLKPGYGVLASGDVIAGIREETVGLALGAEAGLMPAEGLTAVLRTGFTLGESDEHLGRLRFGGGVGMLGIHLDYTVQIFEYLGTIHRIGVRWSR